MSKKARKLTKIEKLQHELERRGTMTHKEMVKFLLRGTGNMYEYARKDYDSQLYGRKVNGEFREGFLYRSCRKTDDGAWRLKKKKEKTQRVFGSVVWF